MPESADNQPNIRARARLALRAERAFGLTQLPFDVPEPVVVPEKAPAATSRPVVAPKPVTAVVPVTRPAPPVVTKAPTKKVDDFFVTESAMPVIPSEPFTSAVMTLDQKIITLKQLNETKVVGCQKCQLHQGRHNTVFGEGDPDSHIMFIGEGPGETEDLEGRPFVGRAGELLDKMIVGMGFKREQMYIANIVKCRPPGNRQPSAEEAGACIGYLLEQIEVVRPKIIVTLGLTATKFLLNTNLSMSKMRGQWHAWRGIQVMPTYHPAYVLRQYTPETRAAVWSDLKMVLTALGIVLPTRG